MDRVMTITSVPCGRRMEGGKWWHIPRVARRGHAGCLKVLMQARTAMDKYKHRSVYHEALEEAATWGRIACVKILVKAGADVNKMNVNGPLLVRAAGRGHTECVEFLLSKGADVNAVEYMGRTACHLAARHGHEDCLYLLIIAGADVNARNSHGHSPNHRSRQKQKELLHFRIID